MSRRPSRLSRFAQFTRFTRLLPQSWQFLRSQHLTAVILCVLALDLGIRSWWRWDSAHNETFDLAFYVRIAWGFAEGDLWNPIVGASIWGLRVSPILYPLGWLGALTGIAPLLLITQAFAVAGSGLVMARVAARRLGHQLAWVGALSWALYPHLGHVATYEFHPGTLALLPLTLLIDAYDRRSTPSLLLASLGVLMCREDFAVILIAFGVFVMWTRPELRRASAWIIGVSLTWLGVFTLILHPRFAPPQGSMSLHFGQWGETTSEAISFILSHPSALSKHLTTSARALYLFKLCAPLLFTPLLRTRWLLPATPIIAMNLLSRWPSVTDLDSHYLTPILPFLLVAGFEGLAWCMSALRTMRLKLRLDERTLVVVWCLAIGCAHLISGGTRFATDYPHWAFQDDERTLDARRALALISPRDSVQVPDRLTPHLAERSEIYRAKAAPRTVDVIVIDTQEPQHEPVRVYARRGHYRLIASYGSLEVWSRK